MWVMVEKRGFIVVVNFLILLIVIIINKINRFPTQIVPSSFVANFFSY